MDPSFDKSEDSAQLDFPGAVLSIRLLVEPLRK